MAGYDFLDDGQADARALAARFGGEEGFEDAPGVRMGDARSIVDDGKDQPAMVVPGGARTVTAPSLPQASQALSRRFTTACSSKRGSPWMTGRLGARSV